MTAIHLSRDRRHLVWNNALDPVLTVAPGSVVEVEVANASGGQLTESSTASDVARLDFSRVNPVTGPIFVEGAEPGDALVIDVLEMAMDSWGWTAVIPGFGLLADMFPAPFLRISEVLEQTVVLPFGIRLPAVPFIGTIGVAPKESGDHSVVPPRSVGGNMDIRQVTVGSRLMLPVAVPGALLSLGDTHAAQGDGEVCGTAIETNSVVTLRVSVEKNRVIRYPQLETDARAERRGPALVTTGIGPDLYQASRDAVLGMVDEIGRRTGLSSEDAYMLCSIAGDLKISEIVDAPHWVVSMHMQRTIVGG